MAIPISYNIRNLKLRKGLTIMTALGIALTVTTAVFLMALLAGLKKAFMSSGDPVREPWAVEKLVAELEVRARTQLEPEVAQAVIRLLRQDGLVLGAPAT